MIEDLSEFRLCQSMFIACDFSAASLDRRGVLLLLLLLLLEVLASHSFVPSSVSDEAMATLSAENERTPSRNGAKLSSVYERRWPAEDEIGDVAPASARRQTRRWQGREEDGNGRGNRR